MQRGCPLAGAFDLSAWRSQVAAPPWRVRPTGASRTRPTAGSPRKQSVSVPPRPARLRGIVVATSQQYVDLVEAGIIDPTKVARIALENAVSVASVLFLTEATLTEVPEKKGQEPMPGLEGA